MVDRSVTRAPRYAPSKYATHSLQRWLSRSTSIPHTAECVCSTSCLDYQMLRFFLAPLFLRCDVIFFLFFFFLSLFDGEGRDIGRRYGPRPPGGGTAGWLQAYQVRRRFGASFFYLNKNNNKQKKRSAYGLLAARSGDIQIVCIALSIYKRYLFFVTVILP